MKLIKTLQPDEQHCTSIYSYRGIRVENRRSQNPNISSFLSLPKGDSANSERSEESYLCPKSDVRRPKLKVAYLVAACHFEQSGKSILSAISFWLLAVSCWQRTQIINISLCHFERSEKSILLAIIFWQ